MEDIDNQSERDEIPYQSWNELDFSIVTMGMKKLPFFEDDLWLGMQAMNVGIVDSIITEHEYALLREYFEIEKTPMESALAVSALSQMWVYNLYEVLRMWRDRKFQFNKLFVNGGIEPKLNDLPDDELGNLTIDVRRRQLETYRDSEEYRERINKTWDGLEPIYRMVELFRMNLAKHCAPGKDGVIPRAPGYGRINNWCGAMDYELVDSDGYYHYMNRRNIADALRSYVKSV
ncbi:hypothetical protein [Rheinheimera sp. MM224]|uniref:hypothetical protein n=1 Tax=Rheinheimera sp. MM224 TaxID=3019969 RepID=UPI0021F90CC0|nr:hypothetical protein [Rheinheimera sp. MM224]CAI3802556.1 hypothetical protein JAMGFMIE_03129 [Rheinheimera sp. MM224]